MNKTLNTITKIVKLILLLGFICITQHCDRVFKQMSLAST